LDLDEEIVMEIINNEIKKEEGGSDLNNQSNVLLNKLYLDAIVDANSIIKDSQIRTWNALKAKPDFGISTRETQNILEKYSESKVSLVILHIDLVGSTRLSLSLPIDRLATIIRSFAQQMSLIVTTYGGYVLKYIGDAVLAFFVIEGNSDNNIDYANDIKSSDDDILNSVQYTNAISCAFTMIKVIQEGINPILNQYDYPELKVRVGVDLGEVAVVQYGTDIEEYDKITIKRPHLDLIGYTVSIAVKMTGLAKADNIVIGQKLFDKLDSQHKDLFKQLPENHDVWSYSHGATGKIYNLYGSCINTH
jgi:adenylate cyclase